MIRRLLDPARDPIGRRPRRRAASALPRQGCRASPDKPQPTSARVSSASAARSRAASAPPRLLPISSCHSSTITVWTPASSSFAASRVSIRLSDSGVVMRSGREAPVPGARARAAAVSPVRMPTGPGEAELFERRAASPAPCRRRARASASAEDADRRRARWPRARTPSALRRRRGGRPVPRRARWAPNPTA